MESKQRVREVIFNLNSTFKGFSLENKSNGIIDNESMYFYKLFLDDDLTILFGWFREKRRVGLFIIKNFQEENETTIYDSQEDEFLEKGKHRKSPPPVVIRYLEDTIAEILGEEYKPPIEMGYDIYSMILNEMMAEKRNARQKSD